MLSNLLGKNLGDSIYSELPSLSTELSANVTSLSGSAVHLGVAAVTFVGHTHFEFLFMLLMAAGMAVLEAVESVREWAMWVVPAPAGKTVQATMPVSTQFFLK